MVNIKAEHIEWFGLCVGHRTVKHCQGTAVVMVNVRVIQLGWGLVCGFDSGSYFLLGSVGLTQEVSFYLVCRFDSGSYFLLGLWV